MQAKMCRDQITHSAGQNIKWYNHSGEQFGSFFKKKKKKPSFNLQLPHNI